MVRWYFFKNALQQLLCCKASVQGLIEHPSMQMREVGRDGASGRSAKGYTGVPVFLYNPHSSPITGEFTFELIPADQNWSQSVRNAVTVIQGGELTAITEGLNDDVLKNTIQQMKQIGDEN